MPTDPSSPSTSAARDAVVEAMASALEASDPLCKRPWCDAVAEQALDAALGVTYTSLCPECGGDDPHGARRRGLDGRWLVCSSCNGSGRSAPRLALIDVLVAGGALEPETWADRSTGSLAYYVMVEDEGAAPNDPVPGHYRIPSSKES